MRLIDADALIAQWESDAEEMEEVAFKLATYGAINDVKHQPTIEPRRGKWIKISPANIYECSVCGQNVMTNDIETYKFCHGCGADMQEGGEDETN